MQTFARERTYVTEVSAGRHCSGQVRLSMPFDISRRAMQQPPTGLEAQVQWLVDRAAIEELLLEYGRCIDSKDFQGQADLFTEDGRVELPFAVFTRDEIPETSASHLQHYSALHHQYSNLSITVDGDSATSISYFNAVHVHGTEFEHGTVGGSYETTYRRVDGQWRLVVVRDVFTWRVGGGAPGE